MRKTALVTGARRGIGRAIAARLARDGFNVVLNGINIPAAGDQFEDISRHGGGYLYVQGDVSRREDRDTLLAKTLEKFGAVHVLVNNAGVAPKQRADLLDMTEESFDYVLQVNTKSNMFLSQLVAKQMIKQEAAGKKRGTIINISSCSAEVSSVNRGEYCVSKAGIAMLTLLYADRLAREGIFVHEIRPGIIETDMTSTVHEKYDNLINAGVFPIARWGKPEDVAEAASVLAGDSFLYTTGNYIDVDGGFHITRL
ncbi:MAG: 3-ketoacyl-ACP reductase [Treponema sp.]|jgi:NAD(P)-dependent dehydrogenase (short-subunit alcohol dehydrogenase family)|nr:3-ketoacyl-ACP reductase [Treponema sp.]